jgi:competence protein ComEC
MVAVFLFSLMLGRARDTLNTLAVAALVILIVFPPSLFSISFQLSFAAVLTIVVGVERFGVGRKTGEHLTRKTARWLIGSVLVSVLAVAGTTPVVLYHFNQTSLVGVVANVLLIPLVGFVVVPMGLVCAVMSFFSEALAMLGFQVALALVHAALVIINGVASLPCAALYTVSPSVLEIGVYYAAGWTFLNWRRISIAPWILAIATTIAVGDGLYWTYQRFWHRDFRVTAIDVGQGTSTLMEFPGGTVMLMDGGGFSDNRIFDMGQRVVAPLLWRKKIARVDILALSHPNADHLNGLIFIARHFHVRELWFNGDVNTTWGYKALMDVCQKEGIAVRILDTRTKDRTIGGVTLSVLHPPPGYAVKMGADQQERRNNASLVIRAGFEKTAFLLTGDIMAGAEEALVQREGLRLASTVLFAPHHGSRTSSSDSLIAAVQPQMVVISAGVDNRFGFPHREVTDRYHGAGSRIWCTCIHGAVLLSSDGSQVQRK